tara:strand:+ start:587 stop:1996 length:1410 start_codon:yes stop_codon:yes gene_type:complete
MNTAIARKTNIQDTDNLIILINDVAQLEDFSLSEEEMDYAIKCLDTEQINFALNQYKRWIFIQVLSDSKESARKAANTLHNSVVDNKISEVSVINAMANKAVAFAFTEGLALSNYQFLKYFSDKKEYSLKTINICTGMEDADAEELQAIIDGTFIARDLVNEPLSYLSAIQYSQDIESYGKKFGFSVEVFHKKKIEALKMGGLLAVNQGSIDPPTFSIMEWKPEVATNKKPIILVGKGIVYDTGGLSLKPTPNSMDLMKSDMGGSAAVVGVMAAIAKAKLKIHVIGLVPATDNRPSGNAYAPGDVITMHDGTSVEVLNTDAEGRLILADALSYAKKYDPELVIDLATLTGAAARAIGKQGIVAMGNDENTMTALKTSGEEVQERLAEFPFWDEYAEDLKSNIADLKNLGGPEAGAITAGKFLEHFTDYPYTHLDIAGPAFMLAPFNYRGKGGTGVGVRLLFNFMKKKSV